MERREAMYTNCVEMRKKAYARYAEMRNARNLKDIDVSKATEIPASTFTDWKNGKSSPKIEKIVRIADLFNVPLDDFIRSQI